MGALAAGAASIAGAVAFPAASAVPLAPGPDNPVRAENRRPGTDSWQIGAGGTVAADDIGRQIKGYTSLCGVGLGGEIDFHVSTVPARPFTVSVYRLGYYGGSGARLMAVSPRLSGVAQPDPVVDDATGMITCAWPAAWKLEVPRDWTSGAYLAAFTTDGGHRSYAPFVVRDDARAADFLVVLPYSTYQAYNQWPLDGRSGKSLYYGYLGGDSHLAASAQTAPAETAPTEGAEVSADANGVPLSYAMRARAVSFDRPYSGVGLPQRADLDVEFIQWAERSGYDLSYATSLDLHSGLVDPARHAALVFSGHDEYWSRPMRDAAEAAVARGTHLAFIAANNVYWHARFAAAPDGAAPRAMECWKTDPDPAPDASGPTRLWRDLGSHGSQAEQRLLGAQYNGIPRAEAPLIVERADHWFWAGADVKDGDAFPGVVGGEADGIFSGTPMPVCASHVALSASPYELSGGPHARRTQNTSLYETSGGAVVFDAGTFNWSFGLNREGYIDPRLQRATANLFNRMRERPV